MTIVYNLAFIFFAIFYLPTFLVKIRQAESPRRLLSERLGIFPQAWKEKLVGKKVVWIHAVSVGEVRSIEKFIKMFLCEKPEYHIVLTTVTPTGQKVAKQFENEKITVCYFPFDLTFAARNFFKALGPEYLLLAETEIWPNLLTEAKRMHVPVVLLNGRLSIRSAKRYAQFRFIFKPLFESLSLVLAQTQQNAERFIRVGTDPSKVFVAGNMKFDNVIMDTVTPDIADYWRNELGFGPQDQVLVAGSTHPGEEKIFAKIFLDLSKRFSHLRLLIAPRHIERSAEIAKMFRQHGFKVGLATDRTPENEIVILNRMGVLKDVYSLATAVFVGGSLVRHGGQNPIEPAVFKRAILHGPFIFNFEDLYQILDREGGSLRVQDADQLSFAMKGLLENERERQQLGENAFEIVRRLQGATQNHLDWFLKERIHHVDKHANVFSSTR